MSVAGKLRIELPDEERGRSEYDLKDLDRINARLAKNGYKASADSTAAEKREADLRRRDELERRPQIRADQQWQKAALAETEALAQGRGEAIAAERSGVKRILDRDPLLSLARCGHISPDQLQVGLEVRELYDSRSQDAGAMEYTGLLGAGHDHERFVASRFTRAKASAKIGRLERTLPQQQPFEPAMLITIRWVCERGLSMSSLGKGRAMERNCAAFARALDVAEAVLRERL